MSTDLESLSEFDSVRSHIVWHGASLVEAAEEANYEQLRREGYFSLAHDLEQLKHLANTISHALELDNENYVPRSLM
jgi:hypothetical protein